MQPHRRHRYLEALGIDRWRLRSSPADAAASPVPTGLPPTEPKLARGEAAYAQAAGAAATSIAPAAPMVREPAARVSLPIAPVPMAPVPTDLVPGAAVPTDWDGLKLAVRECRKCKLCETRTQTVFGVGADNAPLMIVGEGPGADEDASGEPFVGRAGKLLDEMLRAIGRSRKDNVFIANVVKCRPPGNRDPEAAEVDACRPYLDQQIRLVQPRLIVGLGRIAAQRLLDTDAPLSRLRGPQHHYGEARTPLYVTYHPAYLLRSPREKAKSWEDLKKIHRFLAGVP